jgi:hypothetical protein
VRSLEEVKNAIQSSEEMRKRLKALSNGTIPQYPKLSNDETESSTFAEVPPLVNVASRTSQVNIEADTSNHIDTIKALRTLLSKLRKYYERMEDSAVYKDSFQTCAVALRGLQLRSKFDKCLVSVPEAMIMADKRIQQEIKSILETLTIDRQGLDYVLRSIRLKCSALESSSMEESSGKLASQCVQWKLHLQDTYDETLGSL